MSEKPGAPDQGARPTNDETPPQRKDEEFRLLCRRYSRLRARMPG